ncbi:MAG: phosphatase PAP2 family protein [candidate division FCPU426 bacterium]
MNWQAAVIQAVSWDAAGLRLINQGAYWRPLADLTYWVARDQVILGVLGGAVAAYILYAGLRRALWVSAWSAAAVMLTQLIHNSWFKLFFNRPRPFLRQEGVRLCVALNDLSQVSLSFPSTHSASAAALAVVIAGLDPALKWPAIGFALLIGLGTVYSGGHYPADVLAGYAAGGGVGWLLLRLRPFLSWADPCSAGQGRP